MNQDHFCAAVYLFIFYYMAEFHYRLYLYLCSFKIDAKVLSLCGSLLVIMFNFCYVLGLFYFIFLTCMAKPKKKHLQISLLRHLAVSQWYGGSVSVCLCA